MKVYHIPTDRINEAIELGNGLFAPVYDKNQKCICTSQTYNRLPVLQPLLDTCELIDFIPQENSLPKND